MYFPTIVFIFNESTTNSQPRRSQIKLRLNKKSEEITEDDIKSVVNKVKQLKNACYDYGSVRGNYVSGDKRFKTTIYGKDKTNIQNILTKVLDVIPEKFDSDLLSITEIGKKRPSISKRSTGIYNIGNNTVDYNEIFTLKLKSVNLLINGVKSIIKLE